MGRQIKLIDKGTRGKALRVVHPGNRHRVRRDDPIRDRARLERARHECVGGLQWPQRMLGVDAQDPAIPPQRSNRVGAALRGEELGRRVHLQRPQRQRETNLLLPGGVVADPVACDQARPMAHPGDKRGDFEREFAVLPAHAGNRQVAVGQALRGPHVGPGQKSIVGHQERLERVPAGADLDRAVLRYQSAVVAPVDADQRPVRLLAAEAARVATTRGALRNLLDEFGGRVCERWIGQLDRLQAIGIRGALVEQQPDPARLRVGQAHHLFVTAGLKQLARGRPALSVLGELDFVSHRTCPGAPAKHQPSKFARVAQIDRQRLLGAGGRLTAPGHAQRPRFVVRQRRGSWPKHTVPRPPP